jgi:hypothetical protein
MNHKHLWSEPIRNKKVSYFVIGSERRDVCGKIVPGTENLRFATRDIWTTTLLGQDGHVAINH